MAETRADQARAAFAREMGEVAGWPPVAEAFAAVRREDHLPDPPWLIIDPNLSDMRRTSDPAALYRDVLVSIDRTRGINNGQPSLHAGWMGRVRPTAGETVVHIGAGTGYYTAILARLVAPGGGVVGYELEADVAALGARCLAEVAGVELRHGDAVAEPIPPCDVIYVNAGVVAPPVAWLDALRPGGRLVFPWHPAARIGLAVLVTRTGAGFCAEAFAPAWFIACAGASDAGTVIRPPRDRADATRLRSIRLAREAAPDETAVSVHPDVWFSSGPPG